MDRLQYVFVIFFLTLGPIKIFGPFLHLTANFDEASKRRLARRGAVIATVVGLCVVFLGNRMREKWGIERPDLLVTFGILLLISALKQLDSAQHPHPQEHSPPAETRNLAFSPVAFPMIITPYGIVAMLLFAAVSPDRQSFLLGAFGVFAGIMVLNYLAMMFAGPILRTITPQALQAFGWVMAALQASLAVAALMQGLRLGLFGQPGR
jgi:multiple antibiotic resistance protein